MRKLKMRAVPSAIGSVYFEVSSRVMNGRSDNSMRRSHFTLELPSQPGRNSRAGYPCSGRIASPFCPYAISASSCAFETGMLRVSTAASCPSARNHVAFGLTPTSRKRVASATPVHSLVLVRPASCCGVMSVAVPRPPKFPEHSRKWTRLTAGKRLRSARVNTVGRSTIPWISSE